MTLRSKISRMRVNIYHSYVLRSCIKNELIREDKLKQSGITSKTERPGEKLYFGAGENEIQSTFFFLILKKFYSSFYGNGFINGSYSEN